MPHRKSHVLADVAKGDAEHVAQAIDAAREAHADWSRLPWEERAAVFLRAAELLAGPYRSTVVAATMLNQSKTAHQAEIDAAAELIDFWRFNVEFMVRIYERAADLLDGRLEPAGVPAARGLRLRRQPVQLHRHRRQPLRLAGADGEHRRLEAGIDGRALGALRAPCLPGGRAPRRRHQPRLRLRRRDRRRRAREPGAGGHPLHRLDPGLPEHVEDGRRQHRELPQLPPDRRRDRRQGLHRRPPLRRRRGGRDGDRARLVRVPGPEVLGRVARLRAVEHVARAPRAARRAGRRAEDGRRRRLLELHGRRHRRRLVQDAEGGDRGGPLVGQPRSSRAAATTTARATSSSRP